MHYESFYFIIMKLLKSFWKPAIIVATISWELLKSFWKLLITVAVIAAVARAGINYSKSKQHKPQQENCSQSQILGEPTRKCINIKRDILRKPRTQIVQED